MTAQNDSSGTQNTTRRVRGRAGTKSRADVVTWRCLRYCWRRRAPRRPERSVASSLWYLLVCVVMKILTNFASKEDNNNNNNTNDNCVISDNPTSNLFSVSRVTPSLFLCGAPAVREDVLVSLGVGCVVSAAPELPPPPLPPQVALVLRLPVKDLPSEDLLSRLHTTADTIHQVTEDGGRVLVHCVAGVSRSAAIVLAYLVKHQGLTLRSAFAHLRACRPAVRPNTGFFRQLIEFEQQTTGSASVAMVYNQAARTHIPDVYEPEYQNTLCFLYNRNFGKH